MTCLSCLREWNAWFDAGRDWSVELASAAVGLCSLVVMGVGVEYFPTLPNEV